jgi:GT2 family glycosyltransferase
VVKLCPAGRGYRQSVNVTVVIATRNRPAELARTLGRLSALSPAPPIVVVDNASEGAADGELDWLRRNPAAAQLVALPRNLGGAARTVGARYARTPYVAFSDDDSWWAPDALSRAAAALDRHPRLAMVVGRTLVGPSARPDPLNAALAASPLPERVTGLPGRPVLGGLACATVVRRSAFLQAGGFHPVLMVGGEEALLCYDLAAGGWGVRFLPEVVAHHHPASHRPPLAHRQAVQRRNAALTRWLRRPLPVAAADTWRLARRAPGDPVARAALVGLIRRLPVALAERRRLPAPVEQDIAMLERAADAPPPDG